MIVMSAQVVSAIALVFASFRPTFLARFFCLSLSLSFCLCVGKRNLVQSCDTFLCKYSRTFALANLEPMLSCNVEHMTCAEAGTISAVFVRFCFVRFCVCWFAASALSLASCLCLLVCCFFCLAFVFSFLFSWSWIFTTGIIEQQSCHCILADYMSSDDLSFLFLLVLLLAWPFV